MRIKTKNNSLYFVQDSFHKGNVLLFPTTAGRQNSCMAMFAIVYSVFKHVNLWDSKDVNDILLQGDQIYKDSKANVFLNADKIPRQVNLFGVSVEFDFTQNTFRMLFDNQKHHPYLINCITVGDMSCNGSMFFIAGKCIAIIPYENCVYLFDSHSRDSFGMSTANCFPHAQNFQIMKVLHYIYTNCLLIQHRCNLKLVYKM